MINQKRLLLLIGFCCLLSACAHQVPVTLVKPADNGQALTTLAVKPFVTNPYFQAYGAALTNRIKAGISQAGFIKIVESSSSPQLEGTLSMFPLAQQCAPAEHKDLRGHNHQGYSCSRQITINASYTLTHIGNIMVRQFSTDQKDFDFGHSPAAILATLKSEQQLLNQGLEKIAQQIVQDISPKQAKQYWSLPTDSLPKLVGGIKNIFKKDPASPKDQSPQLEQGTDNITLTRFRQPQESTQASKQAAVYYNNAILHMQQHNMTKAFHLCTIAQYLMPSEMLYMETLNTIQQHLQIIGRVVPDKTTIIAAFIAASQTEDYIKDEKKPEIDKVRQKKIKTFGKDYETYARMLLVGRVIDESRIDTFTANGDVVKLDKQGYFRDEVDVLLDNDEQGEILLIAMDIHGNYAEKTITFSISAPEPTEELLDDDISLLSEAKYHALIIGIDDYAHQPDLHSAVNDAKELQQILKQDYGFRVTTLLNEQATREAIVNKLYSYDDLSTDSHLTAKDQLLIFYAGHGFYDETQNVYYWLATNAGAKKDANWIDTRRVSGIIENYSATNVLLVIDSCYAGTFRKPMPPSSHDELQDTFSRRSRIFIASAGKEPADGGYIHSVFAKPFLKGLREISKPRFASEELYNAYISGKTGKQITKHEHFTQNSEGDFVFQKRQ